MTTDPIPLAIVGCGGMGHRHLFGLSELQQAGFSPFELVGACDPVAANAESLANEAEARLGRRPAVVASLEDLEPLGVAAVDITTTPPHHHRLAVEALERGWHVMVEKPMGLTVRACQAILEAAQQAGRVVSVAENYRRDPINRLAKALIQAGVIGAPRFLIHNAVGGGDKMVISVWRHRKDQSGLLLDVGVHYADMMEYLLGPITAVYAQTRLHEPVRHNPGAGREEGATSNPAGVYGRWQKEMPATFSADAEDAAYATVLFASGAVGQYIEDHAGHGEPLWQRRIYGSRGSLDLPHDRSGQPLRLKLADRDQVIEDGSILELVPDFRLDPILGALFGGERLWRYDFSFAETDRKLIAYEYGEFGNAIAGDGQVEVDAAQGARSVAISYALLESGVAGRAVTVDEVLRGELNAYQQEIDAGLFAD